MAIFIKNAILHILNNEDGKSFLSSEELDIDSDTCTEFITKHVKKLISNANSKEACFTQDSYFNSIFQPFTKKETYFKETSIKISEHLLKIMSDNLDIPPADLLIVNFEQDDELFLGIMKLNYNECYTHEVSNGENGSDNQIVKYRSMLPFNTGKVDDACMIAFNPSIIKLIEKPCIVDGETTNYFSQLFLECETQHSKKEVVALINEISDEINQKYFNEDIETAAKIKIAIIEQAIEDEGNISMANVAAKVFSDNEEIKSEFIELSKVAGIQPDVMLGEKFSKQQFSTQRFKSNNGIEIKFPAELSDDPNVIEFINNEDGSVTINLKNLRRG